MPRKPKPHGNAKYDWAEIEARYVASDITLERLCEIYGCTMSTIGHIASDRRWTEKRAEFREFVANESIVKEKHLQLFDKMQFDAMTERSTDIAAAIVAEKMTTEYKAAKAGARTAIEALELKEFLSSLKLAQEIKYRSLNIAPPKQSLAIEHIKSPAESLVDTLQEAIREYEEISAGLEEQSDDVTEPEEVHYEHGGNGKNGKPPVV